MLKKAVLWENIGKNNIRCDLCCHNCVIVPENFGTCGMRKNVEGELYTYAYGETVARHVDPIEKKPFYHFLPGTLAYSVAAAGCNFKCSFCQNWSISQISASSELFAGDMITPGDIVDEAEKNFCRNISYTYTEPTVFYEYAFDIAKIAKERGLYNSFVTNGFMTEKAVDKISPYLDAANVDLKFFSEENYKRLCNGRLKPVLESIERLKDKGVWVEVTTLIIPGENDSDEEIRGIAKFLAGLDREIPWHINRFHPDHEYLTSYPTPLETINKAVDVGKKEGLVNVYPGNVGGPVDTKCSGCGTMLITRRGFDAEITDKFDVEADACMQCGKKIKGIWKDRGRK